MQHRLFPEEKAPGRLSFLALEAVIEKRRSSANPVHQIVSSLNSKETTSCLSASLIAQANFCNSASAADEIVTSHFMTDGAPHGNSGKSQGLEEW